MKRKVCLALILVLLISQLCGCSSQQTEPLAIEPAAEASAQPIAAADTEPVMESEYFSARDLDASYDKEQALSPELSESLTISEPGTYILSGSVDNGMIIVDAGKKDKVQLVLDNVSINSDSSAAIYVKQADKVFITLAEGSVNSLSNSGKFTQLDDNNIDAVIFSKDDVTINGSGSLNISSPAGHGIVVKDSLCITDGDFNISAASNGIEGKDNVCIAGGSFNIAAEKDAIQGDNDDEAAKGFVYISGGSFSLNAGDDGISATGYVLIEDGEFDIVCGGGSVNSANQRPQGLRQLQPAGRGMGRGAGPHNGAVPPAAPGDMPAPMAPCMADSGENNMHGIVAESYISIEGGSFVLDTAEDAFHSNDVLTVNGGNFDIYSGDDALNAENSIILNGGSLKLLAYGDGLDANGSIAMFGGNVLVSGPLQGDTATLDFEGTATIHGGTFIGTGSGMMARTFTASEQGLLSVSVGNHKAGTEVKVADSNGNTLISFVPELDFCVAIISSPELVKGESYTVTVGDVSGQLVA